VIDAQVPTVATLSIDLTNSVGLVATQVSLASMSVTPDSTIALMLAQTPSISLALQAMTSGVIPNHLHDPLDVTGLLGVKQLSDAAGVVIDLSQPNFLFEVTLTGNRALSFINGVADKKVVLRIIQGTPGGWIVIPDANVTYGADLPQIGLATPSGAESTLGFIYRQATGKTRFVAIHR
jgi:hypothetical protein